MNKKLTGPLKKRPIFSSPVTSPTNTILHNDSENESNQTITAGRSRRAPKPNPKYSNNDIVTPKNKYQINIKDREGASDDLYNYGGSTSEEEVEDDKDKVFKIKDTESDYEEPLIPPPKRGLGRPRRTEATLPNVPRKIVPQATPPTCHPFRQSFSLQTKKIASTSVSAATPTKTISTKNAFVLTCSRFNSHVGTKHKVVVEEKTKSCLVRLEKVRGSGLYTRGGARTKNAVVRTESSSNLNNDKMIKKLTGPVKKRPIISSPVASPTNNRISPCSSENESNQTIAAGRSRRTPKPNPKYRNNDIVTPRNKFEVNINDRDRAHRFRNNGEHLTDSTDSDDLYNKGESGSEEEVEDGSESDYEKLQVLPPKRGRGRPRRTEATLPNVYQKIVPQPILPTQTQFRQSFLLETNKDASTSISAADPTTTISKMTKIRANTNSSINMPTKGAAKKPKLNEIDLEKELATIIACNKSLDVEPYNSKQNKPIVALPYRNSFSLGQKTQTQNHIRRIVSTHANTGVVVQQKRSLDSSSSNSLKNTQNVRKLLSSTPISEQQANAKLIVKQQIASTKITTKSPMFLAKTSTSKPTLAVSTTTLQKRSSLSAGPVSNKNPVDKALPPSMKYDFEKMSTFTVVHINDIISKRREVVINQTPCATDAHCFGNNGKHSGDSTDSGDLYNKGESSLEEDIQDDIDEVFNIDDTESYFVEPSFPLPKRGRGRPRKPKVVAEKNTKPCFVRLKKVRGSGLYTTGGASAKNAVVRTKSSSIKKLTGPVKKWSIFSSPQWDFEEPSVTPPKRGRGRPRKPKVVAEKNANPCFVHLEKVRGGGLYTTELDFEEPPVPPPKKGRGRPRKPKVVAEKNTKPCLVRLEKVRGSGLYTTELDFEEPRDPPPKKGRGRPRKPKVVAEKNTKPCSGLYATAAKNAVVRTKSSSTINNDDKMIKKLTGPVKKWSIFSSPVTSPTYTISHNDSVTESNQTISAGRSRRAPKPNPKYSNNDQW